MKIKHIICDWDETLVHTLSTVKKAYDSVFKALDMKTKSLSEIKTLTSGKPKSELFIYMLFGDSYNKGKSAILKTKKGDKKLSHDEVLSVADFAKKQFYKYIEENHIKELKPVKGVREFLDFCKEHEISLYILSSKSPEYLKKEITALGFTKYFKSTFGSPKLKNGESLEDLKNREKPSYGAFLALFNNKPPLKKECCIIGDGKSDFTLAKNTGCRFIPVNSSLEGSFKTLNQVKKYLEKEI